MPAVRPLLALTAIATLALATPAIAEPAGTVRESGAATAGLPVSGDASQVRAAAVPAAAEVAEHADTPGTAAIAESPQTDQDTSTPATADPAGTAVLDPSQQAGAPPGEAAEPTPPPQAADAGVPGAEVEESPATSTADAPGHEPYLKAVAELEASGGAWDPGLAQHLVSLGAAYQDAGRHDDAVRALSRAAHITRINDGLYSTTDIPIVERLIESHAALGEWEAVSGSYQQLFQIHQRNYGERDPRMLPVLRDLSAWHLRAWIDAVGKDPLNHLITARNLYDSSLDILRASYGQADTRLVDTLRERAIIDYYLASAPQPAEPEPGMGFRTGMIATPQLPEGPATYIVNGFISGRDALEQVVELRRNDPQGSPVDTGTALAELGDWHLLFGRRQTAMTIYRDAQSTVTQAGDQGAHAWQQLFGAPLELPVKPRGFAEAAGTATYNAYILVNFSVDERGKPGGMQIVQAEPTPPESQLDRLRKRLHFARFRPRFEGSEPVATTGLSYRYRYSL